MKSTKDFPRRGKSFVLLHFTGGSHLYHAVVDLLGLAGHQDALIVVVDLQLAALEDDAEILALLALAVEGGGHHGGAGACAAGHGLAAAALPDAGL